MTQSRRVFACAAGIGALLLLNGCCCTKGNGGSGGAFPTCPDNIKAGIPIITCQPVDTAASPGKTATFYTEALGSNLAYQWFVLDVATQKFNPIAGATMPTLTINPISTKDYGLYHCQIVAANNDVGDVITQTRDAALGGVPTPGGTGGSFVPVEYPTASSTTSSICGQSVSSSLAHFYPPTEIPDAGKTGWVGNVYDKATGDPIDTSTYVLQWFVTSANWNCCSVVDRNNVSCPVTPGLVYRFTVFFKAAQPLGKVFGIRGTWTP